VRFVVEQAEAPVPEIGYVTGPDGNARIGLPAGRVRLRFFLSNGASSSIPLAITPDENRTYDVRLDTAD
jgi:hypothetical protein